MLRLAIDENFDERLVRGLFRRLPDLDVVRVRDAGLSGADDTTVLAWAADLGRVLLTHDVQTLTRFAYERVEAGLPMPGVFEVGATAPFGRVLDDLELLVLYSLEDEWNGRVGYVPLP